MNNTASLNDDFLQSAHSTDTVHSNRPRQSRRAFRSLIKTFFSRLIITYVLITYPSFSTKLMAHVLTVEANLGPLPVDVYTSVNSGYIPNCDHSFTVRQCVQTELRSFAWQNVTGLRFMFGISGGGNSTALDQKTGILRPAWTSNLDLFLHDVKDSGIKRITPTPVWGTWAGDISKTALTLDACQNKNVTLTFFPALPFGVQPYGSPLGSYFPADQGNNRAYECSPANNINFVGWRNVYGLIDAVIGSIQVLGLGLGEFDIFNEINLLDFTVVGRLIYDNGGLTSSPMAGDSHDVYGNIRSILARHGFSPGLATYSTVNTPTSEVGFSCLNAWGNSARLQKLSALYGALAGPTSGFGYTPDFYTHFQRGLICDSGNLILPTMASLPIAYSALPSLIDVHDYSCVQTPSPNDLPTGVCDMTVSDDSQILDQDAVYKTLEAFQSNMVPKSYSITEVMLGEFFSNDVSSTALPYGNVPHDIVRDKLADFFESPLTRFDVVFRPWGYIDSAAYAFPQDLTTNFNKISQVVGVIGDVSETEGGGESIVGWACSTRVPAAVVVEVYGDGPAGSGVLLGSSTADLPSETGVGAACSDSTGSPHRFNIELDATTRAENSGKLLWIYGVSPVGNYSNPLTRSGSVHIN